MLKVFKRDGFLKFSWNSYKVAKRCGVPLWQILHLLPKQYEVFQLFMEVSDGDIDAYINALNNADKENEYPN